ncbi:MAG: RnfABCDGE type electron transport complex subunit C [Bacilli bacterium]|nr:RnfABCDGE type electron transport complex subunit C [Bacilli bacterium]
MKGVKIPKHKKLTQNKKIRIYNKPKIVYIPLVSQNDTNITVMVKKDDYVCKGDILGKRKGSFRIPIHASVSGIVMGFEEKDYMNGYKVKCVVIENDFKEKVADKPNVKKHITDYTKEEFIEIIKEAGIVGLGGAAFPTYVKYDTKQKINTLIVNAVECEPYITSDYAIVEEKCEEILEAIDAIVKINNINEAIIAIKTGNDIINVINNFIGTYPKIKVHLVPNVYPMGWEKALIKEIKNISYDHLPIEKGIVVNNISTIYAIYEALKYNKPLIERIVTFSGEMFKEPQNILVKIGTPIKEIIESIGGYKRYNDISLVAGGPMMGMTVSEELIISNNLNCLLALKDTETKPPLECLRCGKCIEVCPAKLSPVLIKDSLQKYNTLQSLEPNRCIECGLCSYICPAKINVRKCVIQGKKNLMKGEK